MDKEQMFIERLSEVTAELAQEYGIVDGVTHDEIVEQLAHAFLVISFETFGKDKYLELMQNNVEFLNSIGKFNGGEKLKSKVSGDAPNFN